MAAAKRTSVAGTATDDSGPRPVGIRMGLTDATPGVALLGTLFAQLHGGAAGLSAAMLAGGIVQLCGAVFAFRTIK